MLDGACSGTYIADPITSDGIQPTIISAKHCTKGMGDLGYGQEFVIRQDAFSEDGRHDFNEGVPYKVVVIDPDADLILLQPVSEDVTYQTVPVWSGKTEFGQNVVGVSYPALSGKTLEDCRLSYVEKEDAFNIVSKSSFFQKTSCDAFGGSSGSGLFIFNEETGEYNLMGVLTGGIGGVMTWYTPLTEIKGFLGRAEELFETQKKENAASLSILDQVLRPMLLPAVFAENPQMLV